MKLHNGGPAFPSGKSEEKGFEESHPLHEGMTMRQAYKIAAMNGTLAGLLAGGAGVGPLAEFAQACGAIADAMLVEDEEHEKSRPISQNQPGFNREAL